MDTNINRMRELIEVLRRENDAYYLHDDPIVTDHEYDAQMDELAALEQKTGIILGGSPTQKVSGGVLEGLVKVAHPKPMLSADKTKSIDEVLAFVKKAPATGIPAYVSWKLDGLTLVATYKQGKLAQLVTRGDGMVGEDVTHNAQGITNLPLCIDTLEDTVVVRGECVIDWQDFGELNNRLGGSYSHPRNLAAGSVRLLSPEESRTRKLRFKAFELVTPQVDTKTEQWQKMELYGFSVVGHYPLGSDAERCIKSMSPDVYPSPVDGLIIEYNDLVFGRGLGATGHHERSKIALKWADETYKTKFRSVELQPTRTGLVSLTAVFDPVDMDGVTVSRATLHNLTYFETLKLGVGDEIEVYRANMVIPAIAKNNTESGSYVLPETCPCCGEKLEVVQPNKTKFLCCPNHDCPAKLVRQFVRFCSRGGMDIRGLSDSLLEKLIENCLVYDFADIYKLKNRKGEIAQLDGMGQKSAQKLLDAIEASRKTTLHQIIAAFGIPLVGKTAGKSIEAYFKTCDKFIHAMNDGFDFHALPDFGDAMCESLKNFWSKNAVRFMRVCNCVNIEAADEETGGALSGKTIVITGTLSVSRDEMAKLLESHGAKISGSVSKKTDYLLAGESAGSKLEKAKTLGVTIISEEDIRNLLK